MSQTNMQIVLEHRPQGWVQESDFRIVETPLPQPADGEILVKNSYLSLDPYMRGRMDAAKSYAANVALGGVMVGGTVGAVVESRNPAFTPGDTVVANVGWQLYGLSTGKGVRTLDKPRLPLPAYLGVVGMPGVTAYVGLLDIGQPKAGETVVVSAAAGAVGSIVGQIAKMHGCRVVGIAGGAAKCAYVVDELGFDACVDYRAGQVRADVRAAAPDGIDVYFENVGGAMMDAVFSLLNPFARVPLCGLVSQYNATEAYGVRNLATLLTNRVTLRGFIVSDHLARWPEALRDLEEWVVAGKLRYRETIVDGLENAPRAFIGLLRGANIGKQLVKLA